MRITALFTDERLHPSTSAMSTRERYSSNSISFCMSKHVATYVELARVMAEIWLMSIMRPVAALMRAEANALSDSNRLRNSSWLNEAIRQSVKHRTSLKPWGISAKPHSSRNVASSDRGLPGRQRTNRGRNSVSPMSALLTGEAP